MTLKQCNHIILILFTIIILIGNIIRLWYFVKCLKIKKCNNRKCKYKNNCFKYQDIITDEEKEELLRLLDEFTVGIGEIK